MAAVSGPDHVAIIMDGNGRWASRRNLSRSVGHREGGNAVERIVEAAPNRSIHRLTLFAFSSENWNRPEAEVQVLLGLFRRTLRRNLERLHANNVRLRFVGARDKLSESLTQQMDAAEARTAGNDALELYIAVDYGGRWDIVQAARECARGCVEDGAAPETIDESGFASKLVLGDVPPPDLFIRTGGERRISNFLLWSLAYSELYFCDELWPDFDAESLDAALAWYAGRNRRFGQIPAIAQSSG
ncbi:polyprenyl diphosphate synthase [Salinisphaera orenii]|uniref:polyprenyl diphosphate synthase n=1 Tax=Salinisphaera orenii TaxID=856731 RepID=UPI000DBE2B3E